MEERLGDVGLSAGEDAPDEDAHLAARTVPAADDAEAEAGLAQALLEPGHVPRGVVVVVGRDGGRRRGGGSLQRQVVRPLLGLGLGDGRGLGQAQAGQVAGVLQVLVRQVGAQVDLGYCFLVGGL